MMNAPPFLSAWTQTGVICGTVDDAKLKESPIGTFVVLEGATTGAITDWITN